LIAELSEGLFPTSQPHGQHPMYHADHSRNGNVRNFRPAWRSLEGAFDAFRDLGDASIADVEGRGPVR
jgi:hypothetical protein